VPDRERRRWSTSGALGQRRRKPTTTCASEHSTDTAIPDTGAGDAARHEPVHLLPPLAATDLAGGEQQLEQTGNSVWFVQDQEKARLAVG